MSPLPTERSDEELLRHSRSDPDAFAVFYRRHVHDVHRYLQRRLGDPEQAADLTAEVFAAALLARRRYRPQRASAQAWLYGIAAHKLTDLHRQRGAERRARDRLGMPERAAPDRGLESVEAHDADLLAHLDQLPADQRAAVLAHVVHEQPYRDIAMTAGTTEAVVRERVSRGLRALRRHLQEPTS